MYFKFQDSSSDEKEVEKEEGEEDKSSDQVKSEEEEEGKENNNSSSNNSNSGNSNSRKRKADCVDRDTNTVVTGRKRKKIIFTLFFSVVWTQSSEFRGLSNHPINVPRFLAGIQGWREGGEERYWALEAVFPLPSCVTIKKLFELWGPAAAEEEASCGARKGKAGKRKGQFCGKLVEE